MVAAPGAVAGAALGAGAGAKSGVVAGAGSGRVPVAVWEESEEAGMQKNVL